MGVRKGDTVIVISGKEKGKKGKVMNVDGDKVTVEGVNVAIKHKKARNTKQKSKREKINAPIDISNVQILCKCGKATRIAHKIEKGKKNRICAKCGEVLDKKFVKAKEKAKEAEEAEVKDKDEEKDTKKPLQRREVKHVAESKVKKTQVTKQVTGHRQIGGA